MTEEKALLRLRHGDTEALRWVIGRYGGYVAAIVWNIVGGNLGREDAEEICSDVFWRLWQRADKPQAGRLKGYLAAIARSCAINALRRVGAELPLEDDAFALSTESAEEMVERRQRDDLVAAAVDAMGEPDRTIFLRHYWYCQTAETIAAGLDMTAAAVRKRLERGREKLRRYFEQGGTIDGISHQ